MDRFEGAEPTSPKERNVTLCDPSQNRVFFALLAHYRRLVKEGPGGIRGKPHRTTRSSGIAYFEGIGRSCYGENLTTRMGPILPVPKLASTSLLGSKEIGVRLSGNRCARSHTIPL